jgi:hypothetical protein
MQAEPFDFMNKNENSMALATHMLTALPGSENWEVI